jgi:hypothetical protein
LLDHVRQGGAEIREDPERIAERRLEVEGLQFDLLHQTLAEMVLAAHAGPCELEECGETPARLEGQSPIGLAEGA